MNNIEKLRKESKQNYYSNLLEKHKDNAKQRWQVLKEITGKVQKKNQSLPTTLETENGIISDTKFLGALIGENLSWKQNINNVSTKISKSIDIL